VIKMVYKSNGKNTDYLVQKEVEEYKKSVSEFNSKNANTESYRNKENNTYQKNRNNNGFRNYNNSNNTETGFQRAKK